MGFGHYDLKSATVGTVDIKNIKQEPVPGTRYLVIKVYLVLKYSMHAGHSRYCTTVEIINNAAASQDRR